MRSSPRRIRNLLVIGYFLICATIHGSVRGQSHNREDDRFACPQVRERRAWNDLSCDEQDAFLTSIRRLKVTGIYDTFVQVHVEGVLGQMATRGKSVTLEVWVSRGSGRRGCAGGEGS